MSILYNGVDIQSVIYNGTILNKLIYDGTIVFSREFKKEPSPDRLSLSRYDGMGAATVGNYAMFAGGRTGEDSYTAMVDVYDNSLVHSIAPNVLPDGYRTIGISHYYNEYGLMIRFDKGINDFVIDAYDTSLTRVQMIELPEVYSLNAISTGSVGCYTMIFSEYGFSRELVAVDDYLTKIIMPSYTLISSHKYRSDVLYTSGATVGRYVIFAGGIRMFNYAGSVDPEIRSVDTVDIFSSQLTNVSSSHRYLCEEKYLISTVSIGGYALFAGGITDYNTKTPTSKVDRINSSLTISGGTKFDLVNADYYMTGANTGSFAVFAGGANFPNQIYTYDSALVRTYQPDNLSVSRTNCAGASVGRYALFAGGTSDVKTDVVEVFSS